MNNMIGYKINKIWHILKRIIINKIRINNNRLLKIKPINKINL